MYYRHLISHIWRYVVALFGVFGLLLAWSNAVYAVAVTQGYYSDVPLQQGMIVAFKKDDSSKIEPINMSEADRVQGVVVGVGDANITVAEPGQEVLMTTGGRYDVLVSTQNGPIAVGDYIAISSAKGIGMKSDDVQQIVLGRALESFAGKNDARYLSETNLKDSQGNDVPIVIGRIPLDIVIGKNPLAKNQNNVPEALKRAGEFIAGRPVPPSRIYIGFTLLLVSTAIAGSVVYSAVRSGIISIGRNPLSKKSIIRGIFQMVIVSFIIFLSGIFGVYLILRL